MGTKAIWHTWGYTQELSGQLYEGIGQFCGTMSYGLGVLGIVGYMTDYSKSLGFSFLS